MKTNCESPYPYLSSQKPLFQQVMPETGLTIGEIQVMPFSVSHDAANPVAYVFEAEGQKIGMATDLGVYTEKTMEFLKEYRSKCFILGKNILVHPRLNDQSIRARAIDIDDQGGLVVEYMEGSKIHQKESLTTGEISIRLEA